MVSELQKDLESKRPGQWTQADLDALKGKWNRQIHFTHFRGAGRKLKSVTPPTHEWVEVSPGRFVRRKIDHGKEEKKLHSKGN